MTNETSEPQVSLRERKKARTRQTIIDVSQRLFRKSGYSDTTLEEIARQAEVSVRSLLDYFDSKESLALAVDLDVLSGFREQMEDPGRSEETLELWRRFVSKRTDQLMSGTKADRRLLAESVAGPLSKPRYALTSEYGEILADGFARDLGVPRHTHEPSELFATMLAFSTDLTVRRWAERGGVDDLQQLSLRAIDVAVERFRWRD